MSASAPEKTHFQNNHVNQTNSPMTPTEIRLPRPLVNQILHHAQSSPEREVCGLIGGREAHPVSCYPVKNIAETPATRFRMDAESQIDAMRHMREREEDLFAIYHSHPTSPPIPSATDLAESAYPDAYYFIVSLNIKGVLEMRGFQLSADHAVHEIPLLLEQ